MKVLNNSHRVSLFKIFLVASSLFVFASIPVTNADTLMCLLDLDLSKANTTGEVTITGSAVSDSDTNPDNDFTEANVSVFSNDGSGSAFQSGGVGVFATFTEQFDDGWHIAYVTGRATTNDGMGDSCEGEKAFFVNVTLGTGTIYVTSNVATPWWNISGPENFSGSGTTGVHSPASPGTYSISASPVNCYSGPSVNASPQELVSGGSITFNLTYTLDGSCVPPPPPSGVSGSITCNGSGGSCIIPPGEAAIYSWNSSNTNNCQVQPYGWTGTSGSKIDYSPIAQTVQLRCWNSTEDKIVDTVQVIIGSSPPPPPLDITILCNNTYGPCTVPSGSVVLITWDSTYDQCWINVDGNNENPSGDPEGHIWYTIYSSKTFTARCFQLTGGQEDSRSVDVIVPQLPVAVQLLANGSHAAQTVPYGSTVNMSWTSQYADSCTTSWAGSVPVNGSNTIPNITQSQTATIICSSVTGSSASDQIALTVVQPPPGLINVTATVPDYCASGPAITISWTYSDPSGNPQGAYQVQIDNNSNFNSPTVDSGKVTSGSNSYNTGQGLLQWGTRYYARAKVWNIYNVESNWVEMSSCIGDCSSTGSGNNWKTPNFAYPQANFTWIANGINENVSPPLNKVVTFTDTTVFGTGGGNNNVSWIFGDGGFSNNNNKGSSVDHTYTSEGSYYVTLTAKDNANQQCSKTRGPLIIQKPIPRWREIAPK